jgi:hypothetical protein
VTAQLAYYVGMGRALGLRAEAKQLHWAIVEGTQGEPVLVAQDKAAAPVDAAEASALSWYRNRVLYIIEQFKPDAVGVRYPEPFAQGRTKEGTRRRLRIEGVLLQTIDSCSLKLMSGALATISAKLHTKQAKKYIDSGKLRGLDLSHISPLAREAVLIAVAALPE